jgi:hypothetical protein
VHICRKTRRDALDEDIIERTRRSGELTDSQAQRTRPTAGVDFVRVELGIEVEDLNRVEMRGLSGEGGMYETGPGKEREQETGENTYRNHCESKGEFEFQLELELGRVHGFGRENRLRRSGGAADP